MNAALIFRHLRWALLAALLSLAAGAAAVYLSNALLSRTAAEQSLAQANRSGALSQLSRARDEEQEIRDKIARFQALRQHGILGEERRLDWVEQIRRIKAERKLYDLQYEIAPQQVLEAAGSHFEFMVSPMHFTLQLLHEEDLLRFLDDLQAAVPAYVRTRRCSIERIAQPMAVTEGASPQLTANCDIDWITVRERDGQRGGRS